MNPLDLLGLCEVRHGGTVYPHRRKLAFLAATLSDDPSGRTVIIPSVVSLAATIGDDDWSDSVTIVGEGTHHKRFYDASAGTWFARSDEFSLASEIYLTTDLGENEEIFIRSMPGEPAASSKLLFNRGPAPLYFIVTDDQANALRVAGTVTLAPNGVLRVIWDPTDDRWIVVSTLLSTPGALTDEDGDELTDESNNVLTQDE